MPILNNLKKFSLTIANLKKNYDLQVLQFKGQEGINQPYCFDIELVIDRHELDLDDYLHKPAYLSFDDDEGYGFHGLIHEFVQGKTSLRVTHYHLKLVPQLFYLGHRTNQRIFQQQTVHHIIAEVLKEHGILTDRYRLELNRIYQPRDYCTQYKESDLYFLQRLCEEEGIHFYFEHRSDCHLLVFGDHQGAFKKLPKPTTFEPDNGMNPETVAVKAFSVGLKGKTSRVARRHYDFEAANSPLDANFRGFDEEARTQNPVLEDFAYPAHFTTTRSGQFLSIRALERLQLGAHTATGESDQPMLLSGHLFALEDHLRRDWNADWLLNQITHRGRQPQVMEAFQAKAPAADDGFVQGYRNLFLATPERAVYRSPLVHTKPVVLVSQTATVTGPKGEEIHCDEFGRVKVRFRWDRSGTDDEFSSRWVRVATGWAGNGYGSIVIPRVGMEVLITYDEGDPDRPMLTGYLFNKARTVPYELPANKTRSVFKTLSYPGGGGGNEVRIEDRKGKEQIYLRAQRDFLTLARNDHSLEVGNEQRITVKANAYSEYLAEEHHTTHGLRKTQLNADDSLNVSGSINTQAGDSMVMRAGKLAQLQAGQHLALNAGVKASVSVGKEYIVVTDAGVFCSSLFVVGGTPVTAIPPNIQLPQLPGESAQEAAGRLMALSPCLPEFSWENDPEPVEVLPEPVVCSKCFIRSRNNVEGLLTR